MAILAAPLATLEPQVIQAVLQGASDVITQSQSSLVGGHSIDDDTLKFGLSVTGLVHPQRVWKNDGARVGDKLILTKPLGTGTLCAGLKRETYSEEEIREAIDSMKRLNNIIDFLPDTNAIHAATDITGFGLAGHGMQLALASKVSVYFEFTQLPLFALTLSSIAARQLTKAHISNQDYTKAKLVHNLPGVEKMVLFDPQTSGGLLLSVAAEKAREIVQTLAPHFPGVAIVGEVREKGKFDIHVE